MIHCFIKNSIPSHGSLSAVLRSTMHQALRLDPEIINEFVTQEPPSHESGGESEQGEGGSVVWSDDKLISLWPDIMAKVAAQHPMTAVIDGFDRLKEDDRQEFFDCLEQFEQNTSKPENLKLLVLSRQLQGVNPEASGHDFGRYDMKPEDTGADISKTVQQGLDRVWATRKFADKTLQPQICDKIREISDGTYLSASLIAGDLSRNREVKSEDSILEDLARLYSDSDPPKGLTGIYNRIIDRVSKPRKIGALLNQALLWAAFQKEALKPEEFNIAQAVGIAMENNPTGDITGNELERFLDPNIAISLDFHCGHLVKFQGGRLELVHDSLRMYLMDHFGGQERPNAKLASICIAYLTMPHFKNSGKKPEPERMNSWESKVRKRVDNHKFARYASLYWHDHIENAGSSWPSIVEAQVLRGRRLLEDQKTGFGRCWAEMWWYFTRWPAQNFPQEPPVDGTIPFTPKHAALVGASQKGVTPSPVATPRLSPTEAAGVDTLPVNNGGDLPTASNDLVALTPSDIIKTTPNNPVLPETIPKYQTQAQDQTDQISTTVTMPEQTEQSDEVTPREEEENRNMNSISLSTSEHQEETGPFPAEQQTASSTPASVMIETPNSGDGENPSSDLGYDFKPSETETPERERTPRRTPPINSESSLSGPESEFYSPPGSQAGESDAKRESSDSPTTSSTKKPPQQIEDVEALPGLIEPAKPFPSLSPSPSPGEQLVTRPKGKQPLLHEPLVLDEASKNAHEPPVVVPSTEPEAEVMEEPAKADPPPPPPPPKKKRKFFGWTARVKEAVTVLVRGESSQNE